MLRTWLIIYIFNTIGMMGAAYLVGPACEVVELGTRYGDAVVQTALNKASLEPLTLFVRGTIGNWVMGTANMFAVMNKSFQGKCLGIVLILTMFGTIGYDHGMANWGLMTMAKIIDPAAYTWTQYIYVIAFTTIGNLVGGMFFMAFPVSLTVYLDQTYYTAVHRDAASLRKQDEHGEDDGDRLGVGAFRRPQISAQPSRVISAQPSRGISAQPSRGISAQPSRGVSAHPSRGISAQQSRGIAAQKSR
jgi:hypothetical protein